MYTLLIIVHVICCILLVAIVLLQVGRGRGMMGFLGSGTAETLFGSRAGDVLTRSTTAIAAIFMLTSLSLAYISLKKTGSIAKVIKPKPGLTSPTAEVPIALAGSKDVLAQKGSELVEKAKGKLLEKIPMFGPRKKAESKETAEAKTAPVGTTKSKIRYDEKRNKIVDEYKYDSTGKLTGHKEVTYDRFDKVIGEKDLSLEEETSGAGTPEPGGAENKETSSAETPKTGGAKTPL